MILLLDFDGVIIDSERDKLQASILSLEWLKLKHQLTFTIDRQALFGAVHGTGAEGTLKNIIELHPEMAPHAQELVEEATGFYTQLLRQPKFIKETISTINLLLDFSIRLCVVTNSDKAFVKSLLLAVGLQDKLEIFSAKDLGYSKPDPRFYDVLMERIGADKCDCVVVEDSVVGIQAGKEAGMNVVALHRNVAYEGESECYLPEIGDRADEKVAQLPQSRLIKQIIEQCALKGTSPTGNHIESVDLLALSDLDKQSIIEKTFELYRVCFRGRNIDSWKERIFGGKDEVLFSHLGLVYDENNDNLIGCGLLRIVKVPFKDGFINQFQVNATSLPAFNTGDLLVGFFSMEPRRFLLQHFDEVNIGFDNFISPMGYQLFMTIFYESYPSIRRLKKEPFESILRSLAERQGYQLISDWRYEANSIIQGKVSVDMCKKLPHKFFAIETGLRDQQGLATIVPVTMDNLTPVNVRTKAIYQLL